MKIFITLLLGAAGGYAIYLWMQTRSLRRFDRKLLSLLTKLLRDPDLNAEHQRFVGILQERDKRLEVIRSKVLNLGFTYAPTAALRDGLLNHLTQYPDDEAGHERFVLTFQTVDYLSDAALFKPLLQQYVENQHPLAQARIELCAVRAIALPHDIIPLLRSYLFDAPLTFSSARSFYSCVTKLFRLPADQRQRLYNMTLELLRQNPRSVAAKQLVLDVGRWHFGKSHQNGSPTMGDDERIRHDMQVAAASAKVAAPILG